METDDTTSTKAAVDDDAIATNLSVDDVNNKATAAGNVNGLPDKQPTEKATATQEAP